MIRNKNESLKYLEDLMVCRWENEGGGLGRVALVDHDSRSNGSFRRVNDPELELVPTAVDRAMSDHTFVKQLVRQSERVGRDEQRRVRPAWLTRTIRGFSPAKPAASGTAC
jgi:hypothetical protein